VATRVAPPVASRLSRRTGHWPLLSTHRDPLDRPNPDQRVPGDPITVVAAGGRAVRRRWDRARRRSHVRGSDRQRQTLGVGSVQTLSETERRVAAAWAADCAERVLGLFEAEAPHDSRPRDSIARTRAFARGELGVAGEIRRRFVGGEAAREVSTPAASAAARAAGQAAAVAHMGAHAVGAAAYAAQAAGLAASDRPDAVREEIQWQLSNLSMAVSDALRRLAPVGEDRSGPLGPGLLASGPCGATIRDLQAALGVGLGGPRRRRPLTSVDASISRLAGIPRLPDDESGHGVTRDARGPGCRTAVALNRSGESSP
jgi:hypothetical protein